MNKVKILHAPVDVGGAAWGFSQALKGLGYESETMVFYRNFFNYPTDYDLDLKSKSSWQKFFKKMRFFIFAVKRYKIFYFYFAQSLLPYGIDLPFLRLLGKKVFFIFQGCDARLKKMRYIADDGEKIVDHGKNCDTCAPIPDSFKKLRIWYINLFANKTFVFNPDLLFSSSHSEFLPYGYFDPDDYKDLRMKKKYPKKGEERVLKFLHAPSARKVKGTDIILRVFKKLKAEKVPVELILLENKTHKEVLKLLSEVDVVVDQMIIGWYGVFAVEAMSLGVSVMCYIDEILLEKSGMKNCPIINVNEKNLEIKIKELAEKPEKLKKIAKEGVDFVYRYHNPKKSVQKLISEI